MQRPGSSSRRPGSSAGRPPGTASGNRPPGTATRLTTGMAPGTASGRGGLTGGGVALSAQVTVTDRPVTQQGLGGVKTAAGRGPQRQIMDKTYFLGQLRSKINELTSEIGRLRKEVDVQSEDQSSYVSYEKRAEQLAGEIKEFQGELGDYNTLVDKLNTDESIADIQMDYEDLRAQNDREAKALENLFDQKKEKEDAIRHLEVELQPERSMADNMVAHMPDSMRMKYHKLKDTNEHLLRQLENSQQELDNLNMKKAELEEELAMSPVKQEAVRLYEQLHELEEKRDQLLDEQQSRGTPQQEREKLLKQVKEDNQEIASMERQTKELQEQMTNLQDDIRQLDMDIEENQGERNQKYRELKKREETMNGLTLKQRKEEVRMTEFLESFEENKTQELERKSQLEQNIVMIMEHMSRNLGRFQHMPSPGELANMRQDLDFKEGEMHKSKTTASGLAGESEKLAQDLQKVEQLESKITSELDQLKERIHTMGEEIEIYSDIEKLRSDAEARKQKLGDDKQSLYLRVGQLKKEVQRLAAQYESGKAELNQNETHVQLGNLERKWQHHEQNNFVMNEYIATKTMESDYGEISRRVNKMVSDYNTELQNDTH